MISIPAYFDGSTVRTETEFPFKQNQKLVITVMEDDDRKSRIKSLRGCFAKYANPDLVEHEKEAWEMAIKEKYGLH